MFISSDLFTARSGTKRKFDSVPYQNKKRKLDDRTKRQEKGGMPLKKKTFESKINKRFKQQDKRKTGGNRRDKINSQARDYRPIGGATRTNSKGKFKKTKRK